MSVSIDYRSKVMGKGHAACDEHLQPMLSDMDGRMVRVRSVAEDDHRTYRCGCGAKATWFLNEVEAFLRDD